MKKTMKLVTALITAVLLITVYFGAAASTARDGVWESFEWSLSNTGVLEIMGTGEMPDIKTAEWSKYKKDIKTIHINEGITSISESAFKDCNNLTAIDIPDSVTSVGTFAFYGCKRLENIVLPEGLTSLGSGSLDCTFRECSSLKSINIPVGVSTIGKYTFYGCSSLESITLPENIDYVADNAFAGCRSLMNIDVADNNSKFSSVDGVLYNKDGTTLICCPGGKTSIEIAENVMGITAAFYQCSNLVSIDVDEGNPYYSSVDGILYNKDKTTLISCPPGKTDVEIEKGTTRIDNRAFYNCSNITSIEIPGSITSIGTSAFTGCNGLTSLEIPSHIASISNFAFTSCNNLEQVIILDGVESIDKFAFSGCDSITSVSIPESVTSINPKAFYSCKNLAHIYFWGTEEQILAMLTEGEAYWPGTAIVHCMDTRYPATPTDLMISYATPTDLREATPSDLGPATPTDIGPATPSDLSPATPSDLGPATPTDIGPATPSDLSPATPSDLDPATQTDLPPVIVSEGTCGDNLTWTLDSNGLLVISGTGNMKNYDWNSKYVKEEGRYIDLTTAPWGNTIVNVIIQNGVSSISKYAFYGCSQLASISIPQSVTEIGRQAFYECSGLEFVEIPENVSHIGESAFEYCTSLKNAIILGKIETIENGLFASCHELENVTIPQSVTSIGAYAFENCDKLRNVLLPDEVTKIMNNAFYNCDSLESIVIPDGVIFVGNNAFSSWSNCRRYTHIGTNAAKALSIAGFSFRDPKYQFDLKYIFKNNIITGISVEKADRDVITVAIPEGVTSISDNAFRWCYELISVSIPDSVTSIGNEAFEECRKLTDIIIPDSVTSIGGYAFSWCSSLENVFFSNNLLSIGENAFCQCENLKSIRIPASITSIGDGAFSGCNNLEKICIAGMNVQMGDQAFTGFPVVYCYKGSTAEAFALEQDLEVVLLDEDNPSDIISITLPDRMDIPVGILTPISNEFFYSTEAEWASTAPNIVRVNQSGILTPVKLGTATITLTVDGVVHSTLVSVCPAATSISVPNDKVYGIAGTTTDFYVEVQPKNAAIDIECNIGGLGDVYRSKTNKNHFTLEAYNAGITTMTIIDKYSGLQITVPVQIGRKVSSVTMKQSPESIFVGQRSQLQAEVKLVSNYCTNQLLYWSSSDAETVYVDEFTGEIMGLKPGTATITAKVQWDDSINATCVVTVREPLKMFLPSGIKAIEDEAFMETSSEYYILPDGILRIGARSFAGLKTKGAVIHIPSSVAYIADSAFSESDVTIIAPSNSYAARWADAHNIPRLDN